jgi:hypothetical protein
MDHGDGSTGVHFMKTLLSALALLGSVAFLGGCHSQRAYPTAPPTSGTTYNAPSSGGSGGAYAQPSQPSGTSAPAPAAPGAGGGGASCGAGGKACGK